MGPSHNNWRILEEKFPGKIMSRGSEIHMIGEKKDIEKMVLVIESLLEKIDIQGELTEQETLFTLTEDQTMPIEFEAIQINSRGKPIRPKTPGQLQYVQAVKKNDIVFSIGPAGTGKTYLAMAMAVAALKRKDVNRLILCRPAVEAGESLGFLPGDLQEKVDPYLRPLYDALYDILGFDIFKRYMEKGVVEVAPLAYMRGRTLDDAFVILDEAQNTTKEQMKMFITRLGFGSKMVITGDITQVDLPPDKSSGLVHITKILQGIEGIDFVYLTEKDVVRNPLVQKIILAYEQYEKRNETL
ncbi:MAG TPA: PhoH family protein [Firmicutes bacterium]|nr:PhoH family protein [Bacillota bacterium]